MLLDLEWPHSRPGALLLPSIAIPGKLLILCPENARVRALGTRATEHLLIFTALGHDCIFEGHATCATTCAHA
jgi:hypothetical protein